MENKDTLENGVDRDELVVDNDHPLPLYEAPIPPLTALEFEIAENGGEESDTELKNEDNSPVPENVSDTSSVNEEEGEEKDDPMKEEFLIPDKYQTDNRYSTQSFLETPTLVRPTYLPRFTEVSDTYRMQDDPRPRPEAQKPTTVVSDGSDAIVASIDDPTSEGVEDREINKVVVTSGAPISKDLTDESMTVLKFSTPIDLEKEAQLAEDETSEAEIDEQIDETEETIVQIDVPVAEEPDEIPGENTVEAEIPEEEKSLTLPDPDTEYSVVSFSSEAEELEFVEPLGSNEAATKEQNGAEFTSPAQRDSIKDRFLDSLMSIKVRLVCAAILLALTVSVDCFKFFGVNLFEAIGFGTSPSVAAYVEMQFAICMFLFAIPEVFGACKRLLKKNCNPEIFILAGLPVIVGNDLIMALNGATSYMTFTVLYGMQCLIAIWGSYTKLDADFTAFKNVSKNTGKNVMEKRLTRDLPKENLALDGVVDEYNSKTARMFRTVFVSGFFKRSSVSCENSSNVLTMLGVSAGISLVTGLVSFFLNGYSVVSLSQSFAVVFMLALPVCSLLTHKLPYKHSSSKVLKDDEGAFIGESSIYESADVDVVTYEDTEVFGIEDVKIKKMHLYGKMYNTPKAMKQMYSLFSVVGGPLDYVFSSSLDRKCPSATDIVIEDDGVSGMMEGHRVYAGTEEYMIRHGITIPADDYRTNTSASASSKIMYGAEDNEVYVKFFIRYSFSEEFTMILPELKENKIIPLIYTRDPNITGELVKMLTLGEDIIRVMKKYIPRTTEERTYRHVDSGLVTYGDKTNAINMVLLAKKYVSLQSGFAVAELVALLLGATFGVVLSLANIFTVPETALAMWQVVWCLAFFIRSKLSLNGRSHKNDNSFEEDNDQ